MMKSYMGAATAGVLCFSMVSGVIAQQTGSDGQPVRLSVGVAAVATDNRDATANNKQDNVDIYLRPRVDVALGTETSLLDLYYEPALRYRTEPGDSQSETDVQHLLGVKLRHALTDRLRLRATDHLSITDDPAIEDKGRVLRGDQSYVANQAAAGLSYDLFRYSNLDLLLQSRIRRYDDDDVATLSDVDELSARVQHRHSLTPTLRTLLTGEYRSYDYSDNPLVNRDFDSTIAAIGLENSFTPNVIGSVSAGWQTRDYAESALDSEGKPYVNAEISGLMSPDLRLGAVAGYGLRDSDAYPYASQEYKEFKGFADIGLTPKILFRLAGTYRISTYEKLGPLPGGDETTMVGDAELVFTVTENASLMAGYRMEDVDADAGVGASYTKNTARAGATFSF